MAFSNDRYTLGLPEMDAQHEYLYLLFDRIEGIAAGDTGRGPMKELLGEIERYLLFHFECEEHLMRMYAYAGFAVHQGDHEQAGGKLAVFLDDFENDRLNQAALRIFLTGWLMEHSRISDSEYVKMVLQRRRGLFPGF
jgi:hemerythrin